MPGVLFLHIGHHRTGTTTLQKQIFPALGLPLLCKETQPEAFVQAFKWSPGIWAEQGRDRLSSIPESDCIVSAERLSATRLFVPPAPGIRRDPFLLAAHIREMRRVASRPVKVILGIRRQDHYLASRYARHNNVPYNKGQTDFERRAAEIVGKHYYQEGIWLNHDLLYGLLREAADDVLALPLELMADPGVYLQRLSAFFHLPLPTCDIRPSNVNATSLGIWKGKRKSFLPFPQQVEIRMTPETQARVMDRYREGNRNLGRRINLDLAALGYSILWLAYCIMPQILKSICA